MSVPFGPGSRLATIRYAGAILASLCLLLAMAAPPASAGGNGNNGTIKLSGDPLDDTEANHPHLECDLYLEFFGFDVGANTVDVAIDAQDPTGAGPVPITNGAPLHFSFNSDGDANTLQHRVHYQLNLNAFPRHPQQGYHIKWSASVNGGNAKHKTIWVAGCPALNTGVDKTNDADGNGTYSKSETAPAAGAAVPFRVTVSNPTSVPVVVTSLTDTVAGVPVPNALPCVVTGGGSIVGTTIPANGSRTCSFTAAGYSPAAGNNKTNRVTVTVADLVNPANTQTVFSESAVHTADLKSDLSVSKTGPTTAVADSDAEYTITVTNNGNAAAPAPVTVTDELPAGETYKSATGATCTVAPGPGTKTTATCTLPNAIPAKVAGQPAPTAS